MVDAQPIAYDRALGFCVPDLVASYDYRIDTLQLRANPDPTIRFPPPHE